MPYSGSIEAEVAAKGCRMPRLGLGTWELTGKECESIVPKALEAGYRHIDTAQIYGNEAGVGKGIASSGVRRSEIFITTKVWIDRFGPNEFSSSVDQSLEKLGVDSVDLLLLHWPSKEHDLEQTISLLVESMEQGKTKSIGVSNFTLPLLKDALQFSNGRICTNQIEYHAMLSQERQLRFCRENDLIVTAYSPLARGKILKHPIMVKVAEAHGATTAQTALAWLLAQEKTAVIPKTKKEERLQPNLAAQELELSPEEMKQVAKLSTRTGRQVNPSSIAPDWSEDDEPAL